MRPDYLLWDELAWYPRVPMPAALGFICDNQHVC